MARLALVLMLLGAAACARDGSVVPRSQRAPSTLRVTRVERVHLEESRLSFRPGLHSSVESHDWLLMEVRGFDGLEFLPRAAEGPSVVVDDMLVTSVDDPSYAVSDTMVFLVPLPRGQGPSILTVSDGRWAEVPHPPAAAPARRFRSMAALQAWAWAVTTHYSREECEARTGLQCGIVRTPQDATAFCGDCGSGERCSSGRCVGASPQ